MGAIGRLDGRQTRMKFQLRPRIIIRDPQAGFHHAATKQDVIEVLEEIGPVALYGLRLIELSRAPSGHPSAVPTFGQYHVPGRILIYEQPLPPWRLPGVPPAGIARQLENAGAVLTLLPDVGATLVDWPDGMLRRFILEEVLLHELGHHVLQQHKGKRLRRIARTRDHEAFAARFAQQQRAALLKLGRSQP